MFEPFCRLNVTIRDYIKLNLIRTMGKFEITKRRDGEFQFNLKARNGEVILTSEGYVAKAGCINGAESVIANSVNEQRFQKKVAANGKFYFNLKAVNGQVIGTSQMYETESGRDKGIASVMTNAPVAEIVDLAVGKD